MDLFNLFAKISLDTSEYEEGLEKSEKQASSFGDKLKTGLKTAGKVGAAAVGAIAAGTAAMGTAMVKGAGEVAAYGDNIDKMSQKMGISSTAYQEWDAILQHSGTSIDGMQRGMMTLSKAAETGSEAFAKLGLSQEDVASMNQEELFAATIKGLQGMEEGTERAVLAQQLLGGAAKELGPLLNTSAEETEAMRKRVHELGGVMSEDAVKAAAAYQDSLQDMTTSFDGLKRGLFANFMPGITEVMQGITDIFSGNPDSGVGKVSTGISNLIKRISEGMPKIMQIGGKIVEGLARAIMDNLPTIFSEGASILGELARGIIVSLPELIKTGLSIIVELASSIAAAIPDLIPTIVEVVVTIANILTDPENITKLLEAAVQIIIALADGLISAIPELISRVPEIIMNLLTALIQAAPVLWEAGKALLGKVLDGISSTYTSLITAGKNVISNIKSGISTAWSSLKDYVSEKFNSLKEKITKPIQDAKDKVSTIIDKIKGLFNFSWSLPKIKLPHFNWSWTDLGVIKIPNLSVVWYRKAYDQPYLFDRPTVVGNMGFGDGPGSEMVYGHDSLMSDIKKAMGDAIQPMTIVVQSVLDGRVIGETAYKYNLQKARANG